MTSWQVGDVRITKILEGEYIVRADMLLPDASRELIQSVDWLVPHYADERGRVRFSVHALVLETPSLRVVVDTCVGNDKRDRDLPHWNGLSTSFLQDLERAGYTRESIDVVLCTHLHADHVGWNTMLVDGVWQPTFPNARYLLGKAELTYWETRADMQEALAMRADSLAPVLAAGLVDLIEAPHVVCPEVSLLSTPGHTPGHISVRVASRGQEALITGDIIHHPCQFAHPHLHARPDATPDQARATRKELLERDADTQVLWIGTHFASPTGGRVQRDGAGYRFVE